MEVDTQKNVIAEIKEKDLSKTLVENESKDNSSSDENENQESAEIKKKTQGTNEGQIDDDSVTRTDFKTLEPRPSQPRTSRVPSTL